MNVMQGHEPLIRLEAVNLVRPILKTGRYHNLARQSGLVGGMINHDHNKTSIHALRDVSLTIPSGARVGLVGHNGGGKTSLLRVIAGIYQPTSGTRFVQGRVGALLSGAMGLDPDTTGRDSIRFVGELYGVQDAHTEAFLEEVSEFSGLGEFLEFPIRTYSAGMRTRLGLSIVTGIRPDILILDEVLSTGDRAFRKHARERLVKLATNVKILVLASHSIGEIQEFCDQAVYLEQGRIAFSGSCEEAWERYLERSSSAQGGAVAKPAPKTRIGAAPSPARPSDDKAAGPELPASSGKPAAQMPASERGGVVPQHPRAAKRSLSRAEQLVAIGGKVGVPQEVADSLGALTELPELEALSMLLTHAPSVAMEQVVRADLEKRYGRDGARVRYLALALFQVPAAEARRVAQGIDPKHIEATLANLGADTLNALERERFHGISLETLKWSQRYLAGDLARIGPLQYDIVPFSGEVRAYRHPSTRRLSVTSLAGKAIDEKGELTDDEPNHEGWELALAPGLPMLQMFLPDDDACLNEVGKSIKEAFESFARSKPEAGPLGVFRADWKLDPQVASLFPRNLGTHAMQLGGWLYPAKLSEEKLLRRVFSPKVSRADLASLPRDSLSPLQRGIVDLLQDPNVTLGERGAAILREDFEAKYVEHFGKSASGLVLHDSG